MKIVLVSGHACIRVQKQALPLLDNGHEVHLIARKLPAFYENYKSVSIYADVEQLRNAVKRFIACNDVDIFHVHNEPSWFVSVLKEMTSIPVVLDVHDTFLTRSTDMEYKEGMDKGQRPTRVTAEERCNFQLADGLVFVADKVRDVTVAEFNLNQPNIILPSFVPEQFYKYNFGKWLGGICYEGKVMLPEEVERNSRATGFQYCDYTKMAEQCDKIGMDFHIYGGRVDEEIFKYFKNTAVVHQGMEYLSLLNCVSRHDWGLVGNVVDTPQWQQTIPNKLFEYIACGVPVVAINAGASSELIEEYGIGITVNSVKELSERWSEHRKCRNNVIKRRQELTMDMHINKVENLYQELLNEG